MGGHGGPKPRDAMGYAKGYDDVIISSLEEVGPKNISLPS